MDNKDNPLLRNDDNKKKELKVSSIDFVGLEFSEKKRSRGLPPGLLPAVDAFAGGVLPEVEILVGDASKFGDGAAVAEPMPPQEEDLDAYKPKVSTWGVFPRPSNISKTVSCILCIMLCENLILEGQLILGSEVHIEVFGSVFCAKDQIHWPNL